MGERRREAAEQVQQQEPDPAPAVLDVVAEHPEEQEVAEQVLGARVQEHRGEEREVHELVGVVARAVLVAAGVVATAEGRCPVFLLGERAALQDLARDRGVT